jgi:hypothetical protein
MRDRLSAVGRQIRSREGLHAGAAVIETVARAAATTRRG